MHRKEGFDLGMVEWRTVGEYDRGTLYKILKEIVTTTTAAIIIEWLI